MNDETRRMRRRVLALSLYTPFGEDDEPLALDASAQQADGCLRHTLAEWRILMRDVLRAHRNQRSA